MAAGGAGGRGARARRGRGGRRARAAPRARRRPPRAPPGGRAPPGVSRGGGARRASLRFRLPELGGGRGEGRAGDWRGASAAEEGHADARAGPGGERGVRGRGDGRRCRRAPAKGVLERPLCLFCTEDYSAQGGHLAVLQWARAHERPLNKTTCARAAENGHLEVLEWAGAHGCPRDESTCAGAAQHGHLKVLQ